MDESEVRYRVMAEWGGRFETAAELGERVRALLDALPGPGTWFDPASVNPATRRALPTDSDGMTQWINPYVSRDGATIYERAGYTFFVERVDTAAGEGGQIELSFAVGAEFGGALFPGNQIVVELGRGPVIETSQPLDLVLVSGMVAAWQPDYVTVMDVAVADGSLRPNRLKPKLGYTTWISNRLLTGPLVLDDYEIQEEADGLLLRLTGDHDASRVIHASAVFAASDVIETIPLAAGKHPRGSTLTTS